MPPPDWSPGQCGTLRASSIGGASNASSRLSALSYQWPTNVSLGTLRSESNCSTPARSRHSSASTFYGGHGVPRRGDGAAMYAAAQQQQAGNCWYRAGSAPPGGPAGGGVGGLAGSSSSSMVSLHNVRLSSWGSLPSRSSSSPAHATTDKDGVSKEPSQRGASSEAPADVIEESSAEIAAAAAEAAAEGGE